MWVTSYGILHEAAHSSRPLFTNSDVVGDDMFEKLMGMAHQNSKSNTNAQDLYTDYTNPNVYS